MEMDLRVHLHILSRKRGSLVIKKIEAAFEKVIDFISSVVFGIMVLCTTFNIFSYWFMNKRFGQFDEIVLALFMWVIFTCLGVLYRHDEHIAVTFLLDGRKPRTQLIMKIINDLVVVVTSIIFTYYAYKLMMRSFNKYTSLLKIPYAYIDLSVVIGYVSLTLVSAIRCGEHIKELVVSK